MPVLEPNFDQTNNKSVQNLKSCFRHEHVVLAISDISVDISKMSVVAPSYYQEGQITLPAIKQNVEDERETEMDRDQINIDRSCSAVCQGKGLRFGHPHISGETERQHQHNKGV